MLRITRVEAAGRTMLATKRYCLLLVVILLSCSSAMFAESERQGEDVIEGLSQQTPPQSDDVSPLDVEIQNAIEALRETCLLQELQLPEEKATALIESVRYARNLRQSYLLKRYMIENELHALLEFPGVDQEKISNSLQQLELTKLQYYQQLLKNDEEIHHILSPEEQAKYVLFQRNFNKKLKEIIVSIQRQSIHSSPKPQQLLRKESTESVIRQPR